MRNLENEVTVRAWLAAIIAYCMLLPMHPFVLSFYTVCKLKFRHQMPSI